MTSDVVLTAALRNNLLSLQKTQSQVDTTQNRLATGKKINSALDGPQAFFASQALTNRANDLTRLLDSIGQSIQVIKAADNGVTALTKLVEQADSVAQSARDALAAGETEAKITGNRDLRGLNDLTDQPGIVTGDILRFSITDTNGNAVRIGAYSVAANSAALTTDITINTGDSTDEIITEINNLRLEATTGSLVANGAQAFEAKLNASGQLEIKSLNGGDFRLQFVAITAGGDPPDLALAGDLGFSGVARAVGDGTGLANNSVEVQAVSAAVLTSYVLFDNSVPANRRIADASALLTSLTDTTGATARFIGLDNANDVYNIGINGGSVATINLYDGPSTSSLTIQGLIDNINNNTAINTLVEASYDTETGQISLKALDASVRSIEVGFVSGAAGLRADLGFGRNGAVTTTGVNFAVRETIQLAAAAAELAGFEDDFDNLRDQITQLVTNGDTGYRGTNLLNGDDLTTFFNENRTSTLITSGFEFTADGLGIDAADFGRASSVDGALSQIRDALETVRAFGSSLANNLSIIQARETFTSDIINTLKEGADKLVNADQNEEGAKLLALQTRQSLGVTALSLASQSQQSILRLF